jgi:hypothetical protein
MIPAVVGGVMAGNRGRNIWLWALGSALFPVFLFILWIEGPVKEIQGKFRRCSGCGKLIRWKRKTCKFCGTVQQESSASSD